MLQRGGQDLQEHLQVLAAKKVEPAQQVPKRCSDSEGSQNVIREGDSGD